MDGVGVVLPEPPGGRHVAPALRTLNDVTALEAPPEPALQHMPETREKASIIEDMNSKRSKFAAEEKALCFIRQRE